MNFHARYSVAIAPAAAFGAAPVRGRLRVSAEDFRVSELPLLEPDGSGEHVWVWVRKRGENTEHVAGLLAAHAGVHPRAVSYAGLKDRHAVTEQWFSVQLPGRSEPDWHALDGASIRVLRHVRHTRKLQRGALRGNAFVITVRAVSGDRSRLQAVLERLATEGAPNYFGEQRFGAAAGNLETALQLFRRPQLKLSRNRRSLALSAARALLFNAVLSQRVSSGNWNRLLPGDALQLQGSHSFFVADHATDELEARLTALDLHPTGPLWGRGESPVRAACRALEDAVLSGYGEFMAGLEAAGLRQERRALRMVISALHWQWPEPDTLELSFSLPAGSFATSLLRELVETTAVEPVPPASSAG